MNGFPLDSEGRGALCRSGLRGFDAAYCYGSYEGTLRSLIHLFKYSHIRTLARPLSDLLAAALPLDQVFDAVTPVPLHWRRQWQRGFNQSELLAQATARRRGIPVIHALRRARATETQAGLSNTERRRNVLAAFRPTRAAARLRGQRVLLIDDVMTTGATLDELARTLKAHGATRVENRVLARTLKN